MNRPPPPRDLEQPIGALVLELTSRVGEPATVEVCVALMRGADRLEHLPELRYLAGRSFDAGDRARDREVWKDYWLRTWGARGLLYVWAEGASPDVVGGLADDEWRPAEMCLKVATKREVGGAGDGAVLLAAHQFPRVRSQAMRTLAVVGDTEHVDAVRAALDDEHADVRRQAGRALEAMTARLDLPPHPLVE